MSQLSSFEDLLPQLWPIVKGADRGLLFQHIGRASRELCVRSEGWHYEVAPQAVVDYQTEYALSHPYNASVQRLLWVSVNSVVITTGEYELVDDEYLRFLEEYAPENVDDRICVCAAAGTAIIGDWNAVTDGALSIDIADSDYGVTGLDFSGCADMDAVAQVIQTGIRGAIGDNIGRVRWIQDSDSSGHFVIYVTSGSTMGYLSTSSSGTDISGPSYMNGLSTAATVDGILEAEVVLRPDVGSDTLPDWFLDRYGDDIIAGVVVNLCSMPGKPWSDTAAAKLYQPQWLRAIGRSSGERQRQHKSGVLGF